MMGADQFVKHGAYFTNYQDNISGKNASSYREHVNFTEAKITDYLVS